MDNGTKLTLVSDANGSVTISNDRTRITIQIDGTVAISSYDPVQLTGASLAKLDDPKVGKEAAFVVQNALARRLEKKTSN
jgi:hypothetical protein